VNKFLQITGNTAFWLSWPVLYFYLRDSERTRVVIHCGDQVLVLKDWLGDGSWKLPGGGIGRGEDFAKSAAREVQEETGFFINTKQLRLLGPVDSRSHGFRCRLHCFVVTLAQPLAPTVSRREIVSVQWLPLADLLQKVRITNSTRIILERWHHGEF